MNIFVQNIIIQIFSSYVQFKIVNNHVKYVKFADKDNHIIFHIIQIIFSNLNNFLSLIKAN
jgi:hypothetical protein